MQYTASGLSCINLTAVFIAAARIVAVDEAAGAARDHADLHIAIEHSPAVLAFGIEVSFRNR